MPVSVTLTQSARNFTATAASDCMRWRFVRRARQLFAKLECQQQMQVPVAFDAQTLFLNLSCPRTAR